MVTLNPVHYMTRAVVHSKHACKYSHHNSGKQTHFTDMIFVSTNEMDVGDKEGQIPWICGIKQNEMTL